ncbi:MAG: ATP-dependent DNA helicase UvrD2 [Acidimicrobiaceae bacterium]|nr:ATP-dependent DNA helicase UvrD2 [Acidimicrobiaceae bacterium]
MVEWIAEQHNVGALRRLAGRISDERTARRVSDFAGDVERVGGMARDGADTLRLLEAIQHGTDLAASLDERLDASRRTVDRSAHGDDLRALMSVAAHCADPAAFEDWLRRRLTDGRHSNEVEARLGPPRWGPGVRLATVHRVKGLEWPHVIVLSATEGLMPHRLAGDLEEERRVFHVAITRGSESVLVVADGPKSPFITEMSWRSKLEPAGLPAEDRSRPRRPAPAEAAAPVPTGGRKAPGRPSKPPPIDEALERDAAAAFERLRQWRLERSRADGVPAYVVFSDATLRELARRRPATDEGLLAVPGIGPAKLAAHGDAIKDLLARD